MFNLDEKKSYEEIKSTFVKMAEIVVLLLRENPICKTSSVPDRSEEFCIDEDLYFGSVELKNVITVLFLTISDSLNVLVDKKQYPLVKENGYMDEDVMNAISFRFGGNVNCPELSVPLAQEFQKSVKLNEFKTIWWQLLQTEDDGICIEAVGKREFKLYLGEKRERHIRAISIKFPIVMPDGL
jgi:hypothetical protein